MGREILRFLNHALLFQVLNLERSPLKLITLNILPPLSDSESVCSFSRLFVFFSPLLSSLWTPILYMPQDKESMIKVVKYNFLSSYHYHEVIHHLIQGQ